MPIVADKLDHASRSRFVDVDVPAVLAALDSTSVDLELFPDVTIPLTTVDTLGSGAVDSLTWAGQADAAHGANSVVLTISDDGLRLNLITDDGVFDMQPTGDGRHLIVEEGRVFLPEAPPVVLETPVDKGNKAVQPDSKLPSSPTVAGDPVVQRVLTFYEATARAYFGSDAAGRLGNHFDDQRNQPGVRRFRSRRGDGIGGNRVR